MGSDPSFVSLYGKVLAQRDGGWNCHYCHIPLKRGRYADEKEFISEGFGLASIDHKLPLIAGGGNDLENLVLCCNRCNGDKGKGSYKAFYSKKQNARLRRQLKRLKRGTSKK